MVAPGAVVQRTTSGPLTGTGTGIAASLAAVGAETGRIGDGA
jgi:hypothetical protein